MGIKLPVFLTFFLLLCPIQAEAARGFGATMGTGTTDLITNNGGGFSTASTQGSLSAWIWINGAGGGSQGTVYRRDFSNYGLWLSGSTATFQWVAAFTTTTGDWTFAAPSSGAWHHIGVAYDGASTSNVPTVYVDCSPVSVTTAVAPVGTFQITSTFTSVGNASSAARNWDGKLSDIAVWTGALLTANEFKGLCKGVSPLKIRRAALQLYLPLIGSGGEPDWSVNHQGYVITGTKFQPNPPKTPYPFMWNVGQ